MIFPLKNRQKWWDTNLHPFPFSSSLSIEAWAIAQAHGSVGGGKSLVLMGRIATMGRIKQEMDKDHRIIQHRSFSWLNDVKWIKLYCSHFR